MGTRRPDGPDRTVKFSTAGAGVMPVKSKHGLGREGFLPGDYALSDFVREGFCEEVPGVPPVSPPVLARAA